MADTPHEVVRWTTISALARFLKNGTSQCLKVSGLMLRLRWRLLICRREPGAQEAAWELPCALPSLSFEHGIIYLQKTGARRPSAYPEVASVIRRQTRWVYLRHPPRAQHATHHRPPVS